MIDKQELLRRLKELAELNEDTKCDHETADFLLLEYINDSEITESFEAVSKWYA